MSDVLNPGDRIGSAIGKAGYILQANADGVLSYMDNRPIMASNAWFNYEFGSVPGTYFSQSVSGTGATLSTVTSTSPRQVSIGSLDTGTTTTGRAASSHGSAPVSITFDTTTGTYIYETLFNIPTLSTGTETHQAFLGFIDSVTADSTDGAYLSATNVPIPNFQANGTAAHNTSAGNISPAWPTHQTDDIALLICESDAEGTISLSSAQGFAAVTNSPQSTGSGTTGTRLTVFWARATSSSMAAPTVTGHTDHIIGQIITFRGCVGSGNPWDVTAGDVASTASTTANVPGATTTVDFDLVVAITTNGTDTTTAQGSAEANTDLGSVAERSDQNTTDGHGGGFTVTSGTKAAAGAYTTTSVTLATSSTQARMSIALKPITTANFFFKTSSNSTRTTTDTGIAIAAGTWYRFKAVVTNASTADCYLITDSTYHSNGRSYGAIVVTNSTNIPTGAGRETGAGLAMIKSAGTTSRGLQYAWQTNRRIPSRSTPTRAAVSMMDELSASDGTSMPAALAGQVLKSAINTAAPQWEDWHHQPDFINFLAEDSGVLSHAYKTTTSGAGATTSSQTDIGSGPVRRFVTGTTSTGSVLREVGNTGLIAVGSTLDFLVYECIFRVPTLSTGTQTHTVHLGFKGTQNAYFELESNADATIHVKTGSVELGFTDTDTNFTIVANTWYWCRVTYKNLEKCTFEIGAIGNLISSGFSGSHTTNLSQAGVGAFQPVAEAVKSVGTTSINALEYASIICYQRLIS
jgi:hypothetical protein